MATHVDLTTLIHPSLSVSDEVPEFPEELVQSGSAKVSALDRHTRTFLEMTRSAIKDWNTKVPGARDIVAPSRSGILPTVSLPFGGLSLPSEDEDWPEQGIVRAVTLRALRSVLFPITDRDERWSSREEARAAFQEVLPIGELLSPPNHHWEEMSSDAAMSRLAFAGLGALRLLPLPGTDPEGATWVSDMAWMSSFAVRSGFERYGAIAYFNAEQRIVRIHWSHAHKDVRPGDPDWEHAKWAWKCTLMVGTTVADHLVAVHWLIGNYVTKASRSYMTCDHPIRRLLKPFTWRTVTINYNATFSLCPERGFVHRGSALTYESLTAAYQASVGLLRYMTTPQLIARKNAAHMGDDFPWATDALALYNVILAFVEDYVSRYFAGDALVRDPEVVAFWASVRSATATIGIPELSRDDLVGMLAQFIWCVTGLHEAVGAMLEYAIDPTFVSTKIRPGVEMADVQASMQCLAVVGLTGLRMPQLLNDFSHVCLDEGGAQAFATFQTNLEALADRIEAANLTRKYPCNTFNPRYLETGVSV
ncbi:hypothetical protein LBMAG42_52240 [Deltaproteobacteria bacterium]|nr:hypothetical protein LBMAG42_52240 [Deltaproteobacteria bacterium]